MENQSQWEHNNFPYFHKKKINDKIRSNNSNIITNVTWNYDENIMCRVYAKPQNEIRGLSEVVPVVIKVWRFYMKLFGGM